MTRSKLSIKAALLAGGIGLSIAGFARSQPAAAQSYSDGYSCPAGYVYDPAYGCTLPGDASEPYDYGYYGYLPYGTYGSYYGGHREFGHGLGHGMAIGANHAAGIARPDADFYHGMAGGFDHGAGFAHAGGFGHGMAGGFHGGGGGHR
jgi:hypothetical protein